MDNKDYLHKFRRKLHAGGKDCSPAEAEINQLRENFNDLVDNRLSPTVHTVKYVKRENVGIDTEGTKVNVNVTEVARNDQKVNDERYFDFKWDLDIRVGDEIYWHDTWWILYHEDMVSKLSHKSFTAKKCNFNYNLSINGTSYLFPVNLMNLTTYSDGMMEKVDMSYADWSRRISMPNNEYTDIVQIGTRIMIDSYSVYEVSHIDVFSRPGIKDCILSYAFLDSRDDAESIIAWNKFSEIKNEESKIQGADIIYLGGTEEYISMDKNCDKWEVIAEDECVKVYIATDDKCTLICTDDYEYIGKTVTLNLINRAYGVAYSKEITIRGVF